MKAILLDEAKKWLEENCENQYTRMAVFGIMQSMPTVDCQKTPNEPLTLDELREMDGPVWVACKPIEGGNGYWCLCKRGNIVTPAGSVFDMKEIPHWVFYRRPPEGKEDT